MNNHIKISLLVVILLSSIIGKSQYTIVNLSNHFQNHFGWDISGYGEYCCVSDPRDSINELGNGSVNIYKKNALSWNFVQSISAATKAPYQLFGYKVSMNKKYLAVSEIGNRTKGFMSGKVTIYKLQNSIWSHFQDILPDSNKKSMYFGEEIELYNDMLYIGAPNIDSGCVVVYQLQGGQFIKKQKIPSPFDMDFEFGKSINVNQNHLFIGAPATSNSLINGGVFVYQMQNNKWELDTFFREQPSASSSNFGISLASQDDILVIGAPHTAVNDGAEDYFFAGAVYVANKTNNVWSMNPIPITSSNIGGHDLFGSSVAIKDSVLFASSTRQTNITKDDGSIEVFKLNNSVWLSDTTYYSPQSDIYFGNNIFVFNDNLMVSTGGEKEDKNKGLVYIYQVKDLVSGISNSDKNDLNIVIYPNPASDFFTIEIPNGKSHKYQIFSIQGKLLSDGDLVNNKKIDVSSFANGAYMISIYTDDIVYTKLFTVAR